MSNQNRDSRILIVDDILKNIQVLGTILKQEGYQINVAQNGLQALEMVEKVTLDLILLDVMMPELDGFETCKRLKANPETRDIPVIFLTARTATEDIVQGFELGAVDYISKPFNPTELLVRVHTHLTLYKLQKHLAQLVEERTAQLQYRVRELDGRDRLVHLQMSCPTLPEVYEAILQITEQVLKVKKAAIYHPNETQDRLEMKAALGLSEPGVLQDEIQLNGEGTVALDDEDSPVAQTFLDHKPRVDGEQGTMVPILYNEKALGVLWVDTLTHGELDRQDELDSFWRLGQEAALTLWAAQVAADLETGRIDVAELLEIEA